MYICEFEVCVRGLVDSRTSKKASVAGLRRPLERASSSARVRVGRSPGGLVRGVPSNVYVYVCVYVYVYVYAYAYAHAYAYAYVYVDRLQPPSSAFPSGGQDGGGVEGRVQTSGCLSDMQQ